MSAFDCDVLIAGAGPVGLALALALARAKVDFRIVDRKQGCSGESKAITIQPRILESLGILGAARPLVRAGVRAGVMHMHDGNRRVTTLRYDRLSTPHPYYLHLHQGDSERLLAALLSERDVEVERGLELCAYETDERERDGGVLVELRDSAGAVYPVRCRYLVGCDGGHSRVRELTKVRFSGERHNDNWIMADVKIRNFDLPRDERHGFLLDSFPFVILPFADDYYRVIAARRANSSRIGSEPTLDEFHAIARELGFAHWQLHDPLWLTNYNPSQFIASRFRAGPVFLAGDAAHVNTPIGAQGLNTGVMDALNLGWKLAWALANDGGSRLLLDSYHDERHPIVLGMFRDNNRLTEMVFGRNLWLRQLARWQLALLEFGPFNQRNTANSAQLSVSYRHSPILLEALSPLMRLSPSQLLAGDRVPCPRLHDPRAGGEFLYDLLDAVEHTLLVFDDGRRSTTHWIESLERIHGRWLKVVRFVRGASMHDAAASYRSDPHGDLAHSLGLKDGRGAVLVRPDAYMAGRIELGDSRLLDAYHARLCGRSPQGFHAHEWRARSG